MQELVFATATAQAKLVRDREFSPVELVSTYLAAIDAANASLRAYVTVDADRALDDARAKEARLMRGEPLPPFHGVPISIKDLNNTAGIRTTYSTRSRADHVPLVDDAVVRRIRDAGFIILGKTNVPEFGMLAVTESALNGVCRNPWDLNRTPGGSSGGAAAALAAGLCPISHGSDGGGSARIPASCCGLIGLKPARGRASHAPGPADPRAGLPSSGPIARTVEDAAGLLDVMSGYEVGDPYWAPPPDGSFALQATLDPGQLRIAYSVTPAWEATVSPDCIDAVSKAASLLESLGHHVEAATPDWREDRLYDWFVALYGVLPAGIPMPDLSLLESHNRDLIQWGMDRSSHEYVQAVLDLQMYARRVSRFWTDFDVLVTPTLALPPVPIGWALEDHPWKRGSRHLSFWPFTAPANITGLPAMSLPLHWNDDGLPIGVQFVGRPAGEAPLLQLARHLETASPWQHMRPPLPVSGAGSRGS